MPFRLNFFMLLVGGGLLYEFVSHLQLDSSSFASTAWLMGVIVFYFFIVCTSLSIFTALMAAMYFRFSSRGGELIYEWIDMGGSGSVKAKFSLPHAFKPLLGYVKLRLYCNDMQVGEDYTLGAYSRAAWIPIGAGVSDTIIIPLPDIREYVFTKAVVHFQDMFFMSSFAVSKPIHLSVINSPQALRLHAESVIPSSQDEDIVKTDKLFKKQGEWLQYKKFEQSDDIRRIVWKLFAKNKELIVRMPEMHTPYASKILMFVSFADTLQSTVYPAYAQLMQNYYKNIVWTIYESLLDKEVLVQMGTIQHALLAEGRQLQAKEWLSKCCWAKEGEDEYRNKLKSAGICIIHSFCSPDVVAKSLESYHGMVIFVRLRSAMKYNHALNWLGKIFFTDATDPESKLKSRWLIHPLRLLVTNNEKEIIAVLKKSANEYTVV